jgi:Fic family protein
MDNRTIEVLAEKFRSLPVLSKSEQNKIEQEFTFKYIENSLKFAGTPLTQDGLAHLLSDNIEETDDMWPDFEIDTGGHFEGVEVTRLFANQGSELNVLEISRLHSFVQMSNEQERGRFRTLQTYDEITGLPYADPATLDTSVRELINDYHAQKGEAHIIDRLGEFLVRFIRLHPFTDGNDRVARLVVNMELIRAGFVPIIISYDDRERYYACFDPSKSPSENYADMADLIRDSEFKAVNDRLAEHENALLIMK